MFFLGTRIKISSFSNFQIYNISYRLYITSPRLIYFVTENCNFWPPSPIGFLTNVNYLWVTNLWPFRSSGNYFQACIFQLFMSLWRLCVGFERCLFKWTMEGTIQIWIAHYHVNDPCCALSVIELPICLWDMLGHQQTGKVILVTNIGVCLRLTVRVMAWKRPQGYVYSTLC